ncbi:MAG TPA: hypothetical protein VEQ60_18150, partial [Longimicrobium sp.]|nr:hypothetical protein [Longimicrobium sp.]
MNPADPAAWLFARTSGGIRWGLERTEELLAGVDHPHRRFRALHVAGTNGKGSVSALCESALRAAHPGRTIGLYTSPHLVSFTERIRIDGRPVDAALFAEAEARLRPAIERTGAHRCDHGARVPLLRRGGRGPRRGGGGAGRAAG